ncbi:hypothetical protein [Teredinibacter sp. KSP-S5-2]|uniref:hypothetical protein n=1 Tax=Teredinibacter sp. KSP-S5-2 TaxID=3034506 RepID=UPI00293464F9|nr:hypothetical protein [Teredinibacter sp. KSP-S5-2]WNO08743.1 hypothetical protein P5V12_17370 [Teredinibacter sp. KSP-S5-2]
MAFGRKRIPKHLILDPAPQSSNKIGFGWLVAALLLISLSMFASSKLSADEIRHSINNEMTNQVANTVLTAGISSSSIAPEQIILSLSWFCFFGLFVFLLVRLLKKEH